MPHPPSAHQTVTTIRFKLAIGERSRGRIKNIGIGQNLPNSITTTGKQNLAISEEGGSVPDSGVGHRGHCRLNACLGRAEEIGTCGDITMCIHLPSGQQDLAITQEGRGV